MGIQENEAKENRGSTDLESVNENEKRLDGTAVIPEFREQIDPDTEYRDFPEEKIWTPQEEVNEWVPFYVYMARSVLTFAQERQGISNREAMENSCTGYAEQYITDVLHDSEYSAETALKTLFTKQLPGRLCSRWTADDIELFIKGITKYGKNFSNIRKGFLPRKDTKDIVDFYYAWKWSEPAKQLRSGRHQRRTRSKRFPSINCIFNGMAPSKIVTRSVAAKLSLQKKEEAIEPVENELLRDITSVANSNEESVDDKITKTRRHSKKLLADIKNTDCRRKSLDSSSNVGRKRRRNGSFV